MSPLFGEMAWLLDSPRSVFEQMAIDQLMLEELATPALRFYRWTNPAATLGYFSDASVVRQEIGERPWTRRLTGGGVVLHDRDWTYAMVVPRRWLDPSKRLADWYAGIHERLLDSIGADGMRLQTGDGEGEAGWCFRRPVDADLIDGEGRKVAGAAIRATRAGLLLQGSVRAESIDWERFVGSLGSHRFSLKWPAEFDSRFSQLAQRRYASHDWRNHRRGTSDGSP